MTKDFYFFVKKIIVNKVVAKENSEARNKGIISLLIGGVICFGGIALTMFSEGNVIFYGAIVVGFFKVIEGFMYLGHSS